MRPWTLLGLVAVLLVEDTLAFKAHDFKTCSQSGFCRRGRALAARAKESKNIWKSPYSVVADSITINSAEATFTARVKSSLYPDIKFGLELRVHEDGVVRVRMDEIDGLRKRYDEAASWALIAEPKNSNTIRWTAGKKDIRAVYGEKKDFEVVVSYEPLRVALFKNGKEQVVLNGQGLLHMEHFRNKAQVEEKTEENKVEGGEENAQEVLKPENPRAWFEGDNEDAYWEETFSSWTDSKPKGPESLSLDITFPNHGTVYGIPQHATRLALPSTTGDNAFFSDPYRLYNADVFEYLASSPVSLYGSIPVMHAHSTDSTVGVFNAVGSEAWIDVSHASEKSTETHWVSESGILDLFLLPGPTAEDIFKQYTKLTGTPVLPAHWALGYHQCRWNYVNSDDIRTVQKRFDEDDFPVDVFWLDIEYSEGHKYFIWDEKTFPDPVEMVNDVSVLGRKMVVIIDPHFKRTSDYPVYQKASEKALLIKPKNGEGEYEGWCWSGSSSWVDFFNPGAWDWWKSLFKTQQLPNGDWSWTQSTEDVHIWNDMNEPSIFNGPEITMPKDSIHYDGWEHRDVHNINGMLFSNHTWQAVHERSDPPKRPFVLTRSFFAGSQRFGAMWTGDNLGTWEHMAVGVKMVLSNSIAGMSFAGSDVGGFFGNPEPEMLVRWYQVGAFAPFFRAHAHIDTKRREPFLLDEPYKSEIRNILRLRYSLLPVWYTQFRETTVTGLPVLRPHYIAFPKDKEGFNLDDQYFIGSSGLLVKPVTEKGVTEATVYLPAEDQVYYDYFTFIAHRSTSRGKFIFVPAALNQIPLFIRGGSIIPTRERPRRASTAMKHDPFTLRVALTKYSTARGELYLDDGESYDHEKGQLVWRQFTADKTASKKVKKPLLKISSRDMASHDPDAVVDGVALKGAYTPNNSFAESIRDVRVERIVVAGLDRKPKSVKVEGESKELVWEWSDGVTAGERREGPSSLLIIKDPKVLVTKDWSIVVE
ncbi:glycoside hydrolase family 31 protein, partial [Macrolepiota fuliginosa MF-IS2]